MATVKCDDLMLAFDFVGSAPPFEHCAYISLDTGSIYFTSEMNPMENDLPDDLGVSGKYLAIPHKNDLDLGMNLASAFVEQELPDRYADARDIFRSRGAYCRFKELLDSERLLDKWYKFEADSVGKALREWCAENNIGVVEE